MQDFYLVSKSEYELQKWLISFSQEEMWELIAYKDVFVKYLDMNIHALQAQLASLQCRGNEEKVYTAIETMWKLKEDIKNSERNLEKYLEEKRIADVLAQQELEKKKQKKA